MISKLEKAEIRQARRLLLGDDVFVIVNDWLKQLNSEGRTDFAPTELYLSARDWAKTIMELPDVMEGLDEEMDDLVDDADSEDDAMIVMMLATAIVFAVSVCRVGFDVKAVIMRIYSRWVDHPLFDSFIDVCSKKEEARYLAGKKTRLLTCLLEQIDEEGEGSEAVRQLFGYFVETADTTDKETIKGCLIVLNKYNIDHGNAYNKEIEQLYEKLGMKSKNIVNAKEYVQMKVVENEIGNVAAGATGVAKYSTTS